MNNFIVYVQGISPLDQSTVSFHFGEPNGGSTAMHPSDREGAPPPHEFFSLASARSFVDDMNEIVRTSEGAQEMWNHFQFGDITIKRIKSKVKVSSNILV